jgi:hypothetical protein
MGAVKIPIVFSFIRCNITIPSTIRSSEWTLSIQFSHQRHMKRVQEVRSKHVTFVLFKHFVFRQVVALGRCNVQQMVK